MSKIKRYLFGISDDSERWEIIRSVVTIILAIFMILIAFQVNAARIELYEIQKSSYDLGFFCEEVWPYMKNSSIGKPNYTELNLSFYKDFNPFPLDIQPVIDRRVE